ncbi:MAG: hypothetical protein JRN58_09860 [Nitrososphaerota archaeon]|nr:hypothetical protein [Nitrososphaerota archaeon]MDG6979371.1 hypothetical protein [Nitrososphaerota archaeon]
MELCLLCKKEDSIIGATALAIPVGETCYARLLEGGASWGHATTVEELKDMLARLRCPKHGVDSSLQVKLISGNAYRYAAHRMEGRVVSCYLGVG